MTTAASAVSRETWAPLAEWRYVDRDICGISLHNYVQGHEFASSDYGRDFCEQLRQLEISTQSQQSTVWNCELAHKEYVEQEQLLDKSLIAAGVRHFVLRGA